MAQEALVCVQDRLSEPRTLSREGKRERIVDAGEADLRGIAELVLILARLMHRKPSATIWRNLEPLGRHFDGVLFVSSLSRF
jgi:hypothetical protein